MEFTVITPEDFKTTSWSGGTTTQLYIDPPTADYAKRDFNFRLSSASVEIEKSDFTRLPGVSRKIMVLDGKIIITHENQYAKTLNKFDTDAFKGDWKTTAEGTCTDFNLMTTGKTQGALFALIIKKPEVEEIVIDDSWNWLFFYVFSGKVSVNMESEMPILKEGHLLAVNKLTSERVHVNAIENSEVVVVAIATI